MLCLPCRAGCIGFLCSSVVLASISTSPAAEPAGAAQPAELPRAVTRKVDFVRDIQPLLQKHCADCHGPDLQEGRLRVDARRSMFGGGITGPAVVAGKSEQSLLLRRVAGLDGEDRMPLDADPLSDDEIALLRGWIDQGAAWPENVGAVIEEQPTHWAYVKPQRPELPEVSVRQWPRNAIDHFVLARLDEAGLRPSPEADRAKLLRRVYLDLIGLPPTVEQLDAFLSDQRPDAYERAVKGLLNSPHYGERWARLWLDLARYADSNGYQADQYREVWPYRDWVINAMNADMPFDQFTIEQIAGDLLPGATLDQKIATGFHRQTTCNVEAGVDPEENRVNQVIDRVNTTGTVWLGSTIECSQCHSHKYDPFSQRDYYGMFAFFNNTPLEVEHKSATTYDFYGPKLELPLTDEQQQQRRTLATRRDQLQAELSKGLLAIADEQAQWERQQIAELTTPEKKPTGTAPEETTAEPEWTPLEVVSFASSGGADHQVLEDGSVLVSGEKPDTDTYTLVLKTNLSRLRGLKLEALTHPSLPGKGPGRYTESNPNFVLHELEVRLRNTAAAGDDVTPPTRLKLTDAHADYSQARWAVAGAVDGDLKTGWAIHPEFHQPHWAHFRIAEDAELNDQSTLEVRLVQNYGGGRTLGRLRLLGSETAPPQSESKNSRPADQKTGLPENIVRILKTKPGKRNGKQREELTAHYLAAAQPELKKLSDELDTVKGQIAAIKPHTSLVMVEMDERRETRLFKRGNFLTPAGPVDPATPRVLHELPADAEPDRLALAKWLVDRDNPLVARVTVNRWWAAIFGEGLVRTEEDFGTQGDRPTHPLLLDWLAVEFMDSGWSMKQIHEQIVLSATYRQSSRVTPELLEADPDNRLLARAPRFRLPAETVRDNALVISGEFSEKMGGPPVYPPQPDGIWRHVGRNAPKYATSTGDNRFRRGIYTIWRRSAPYPAFMNFDAPERSACVVQRPRTNTPLQALTLLNDEAFIELTFALARRMAAGDGTAEDRIITGFRACTSRTPDERELEILSETFREELARFEKKPQAAAGLTGGQKLPTDITREQLAAWFSIANILMNLDETISKG